MKKVKISHDESKLFINCVCLFQSSLMMSQSDYAEATGTHNFFPLVHMRKTKLF